MEYKDFVEQVKDQIQDFLPEKFWIPQLLAFCAILV